MSKVLIPRRDKIRRTVARLAACLMAFALILAFFPLQALAVDDGVLYGTYTLTDSLDLSSFSTKSTSYNFSSGITVGGTTYTYVILSQTLVGFGNSSSIIKLVVYSSGAWTDDSYKNWTFSTAATPSSDFLTWFSANLAASTEDEDTDASSPSFDESLIDPDNFNVIHYEDYIVETYFDGTSDVAVVTFPTDLVHTYAYSSDGVLLEEHIGSFSSSITQADTMLFISLFGTEFAIDSTDGYQYYSLYPTGNNVLSLADFPDGTTATFDIDIASGAFYYGSSFLYQYELADDFLPNLSTITKTTYTKYDDYFNLNCDITLPGSSSSAYSAYGISLEQFNLGDYTFTVNSVTITFSVEGLLSWYEETGKTNELLEDILDKLDEIHSGGSAGSDLIDKGDQISDSASDLDSSISIIDDFEKKYFGEVDNHLNDVLGVFDISPMSAQLNFIQDYINRIVDGIPAVYLSVFTLPIGYGIFLFLCNHPVRVPSPDTSGDVVTRETFTETTILTGRHAGKSTSTRTVTRSSVVGRESKE